MPGPEGVWSRPLPGRLLLRVVCILLECILVVKNSRVEVTLHFAIIEIRGINQCNISIEDNRVFSKLSSLIRLIE